MTQQEAVQGLSPATFFSSASRGVTAGTAGSTLDTGNAKALVVSLNVTANSGTNELLDVKMQHSANDSLWFDIASGAFAQAAGTTSELLSFTVFHRYVRAYYVLAGTDTPLFTFSVIGTAK